MTDDDLELMRVLLEKADQAPTLKERAERLAQLLRTAGWKRVPADCGVIPLTPNEKMEAAFLKAFTGCEDESFQAAISAGIRAMIATAEKKP